MGNTKDVVVGMDSSTTATKAIAQGCDMATASTLPGSVSQRNYERAGFEVVYTKVTLVAPATAP